MKQTIRRVYIEITARCNLNCAFCTAQYRTGTDMDPAFFREIILQVRDITPYVYLHVQGEPLCHPRFDELMDICDECGMQVQLVTNGTLLRRWPGLIHHSSLRKISFSMQSIEYHTLDVNSFFQDILAFAETASLQGRPVTEIRFWRDDQFDQPRTEACISYLHEHYPLAPTSRKNSYELMKNVYVDFHNTFVWPSMDQPELSGKGTCLGGIRQIAVLSDGTVVPCCLDAEGAMALGSLHDQSLADILKTDRYIQLCDGFRSHILKESLSRRCTYRCRFDQ